MSPTATRAGYLPDSLTLEAEGWKPCPTKNPAFIRDHPTREDLGCRLWPDYETGRLSLMEHERRKASTWQPGPLPLAPAVRLFRGICADRADFLAVLRMVGWADTP